MTNESTQNGGQGAAAASIDWTALEAKWQAQREAEAAARKIERGVLLELLRGKGVTRVEAPYDGCGDSGNVGEIALQPEGVECDDLNNRLQDFIWGMAYDLHPGFEINDGAEGTLTWDVTADRIDIEHANFYTDRHDYSHENV